MPDEDLIADVVDAAHGLISESRSGDVEGTEIAAALGRDSDDVEMFWAFKEADRRGLLDCLAFEGGMGLPGIVRLP